MFTTSFAFGQSEALKVVVNNLAFYKQKGDLKFLANAKKSADSLVVTKKDSSDLEKNVYRIIVNSSILYTDSLNTLGQPDTFLDQTAALFDLFAQKGRIYKYQPEMDYAKRCIANVYIRKGFALTKNNDFKNAVDAFQKAKKYAPGQKQINAYIAYASNKLGNLQDAAKYYTNLINTDSTSVAYLETASTIYKSLGDTAKALQIVKKGRRLLPQNKQLLHDEANIYNNKKDYKALEPLLIPLIESNVNNPDITFVAANCYDNLNQYDKAESLYLRAIELNGAAYEPVFNLGLLYFKKSTLKNNNDDKNITSAILWLEKANEMAPKDKKCLELLQIAYTKTGNQNQLDRVNNRLEQIN
ncbi:tetratricopeptide repeat protein [Mucilaginibacter terrigena]|uniref:tetratricopeptide repeat protein n=1 Tax=Mucilaginibacter terrigena TaxID=2492395 RepID=UPI00139690AE|nr:tetratricopeptide repeat protein [Mucilaginibacter terrigena]